MNTQQSLVESCLDILIPYNGECKQGVDTSTLTGKVMSGYQGWHGTPMDGINHSWKHYSSHKEFGPGNCKIDLWPDVSELDDDEKYPTPFQHADGSTAYLYSSVNRKTVLRHFRWMADYGLDGVFLQRFYEYTVNPDWFRHAATVLSHCRAGANLYGRAYALMYDLSGMGPGGYVDIMADWKMLVDTMGLSRDPNDRAYLHHKGKPIVALWGVGFPDRHERYSLADCLNLVEFLKDDPVYGGNTVMLGVPTYWRSLSNDCVSDSILHEIIQRADIVSPWTVGRFGTLDAVESYVKHTMVDDMAWCRERDLDYLPVVFPGFSWHNMFKHAPLNQIPRQKGQFLWKQYYEVIQAGASMVYQAMFDEIDEGTAIYKCTNNPPVGASPFVDYEGLPSDFYLRLVGVAGRALRKEIPLTEKLVLGEEGSSD